MRNEPATLEKCERCNGHGYEPTNAVDFNPGYDGACRDCNGNGTVHAIDCRCDMCDPDVSWGSP